MLFPQAAAGKRLATAGRNRENHPRVARPRAADRPPADRPKPQRIQGITVMTSAASVRTAPLVLWLAAMAGCAWPWPCPGGASETVSVVLTFDDGPFPADVPPQQRAAGDEALLDPLKKILEVLQRRDARAVFFVAAPGPAGGDPPLLALWARGLHAIHAAGHVLGYHAFDHNPDVWATPLRPPAVALPIMRADLDELEKVIDQALETLGLARTDVFSPLFRQPFGGALIGARDGRQAARERGWTYHAYAIDSADWIANADAAPAMRDRILACAPGDATQAVIDRLMTGTARGDCRDVLDVLMHVNSLSADHLDEWMDTLATGFARRGRAAVFEVPDAYMTGDTLEMDLSPLGAGPCDQ